MLPSGSAWATQFCPDEACPDEACPDEACPEDTCPGGVDIAFAAAALAYSSKPLRAEINSSRRFIVRVLPHPSLLHRCNRKGVPGRYHYLARCEICQHLLLLITYRILSTNSNEKHK